MFKRAATYLGVFFAIFARDVRRVLKNPVALVIALGMIAMPSAYAWYVVAANWDPYNNTEGMLVAVANNDKGADSAEAGRLDVGGQVVDDLHENHDMGWVFTDEEDAINGVYAGTYWAALVIPEDFSEDFASVLTGDFTQPTIQYYVNEKPSSIAPKVTDAAAAAVEKSINEQFVETVAEKVVSATQEAGAYTEGKADQAEGSLAAGVQSAHDTVVQARDTLGGLEGTIGQTRTAVQDADGTLAGVQDSLPQLEAAIDQSRSLLKETRATVGEYGTSLATNATTSALDMAAAAQAAQRALGTVQGDVAQAEAQTRSALTRAQEVLAANKSLVSDLEAQSAATPGDATISQALADARAATDRLSATVDALQGALDAFDSSAAALEQAATTLNQAAEAGSATVQQTASAFQSTILPALTASLDSLADACGTLDGAVAALGPSLAQARAVLAELDSTLESSSSSLGSTVGALDTMEGNLQRTLTDLKALQDSSAAKALADYLKADPETIGAFMASPVELDTQLVYPVKNYGSGVTPFFTNLALWVAGFILMAMVKLRVDPEGLPKFTATQAYFGRWLFYVTSGLAMGLLCCVGDLAMGIQCVSPAAFIGAGLLTVFVDVNLMFALAYAFRHIGKAVAVILLIMQIPGSSGMFPIEMMPPFFQAIHPLLPFTYSIDAMREAIGGFYGLDYLRDMLLLALLFVPLGLFIGLFIGRHDFNLNLMFDTKLAATDLLLAEPVGAAATGAEPDLGPHYRTRTLMRALLNADGFRETLVARAARFRRRYPKLVRIGWILLLAQPLATFAIMVAVHADVDTRVEMLMAMVVGIILVNVYLVVITYLNESINHQLALADLPREAMRAQAGMQVGAPASEKQAEDGPAKDGDGR